MQNIVHYTQFQANQLQYTEPKLNVHGKGKSVYQHYVDGKRKCVIQTPVLYVPFAVSQFQEEGATYTKYTLVISLKDCDPLFREMIQSIDESNVVSAIHNNRTWFSENKEVSAEIMQDRYRRVLRSDSKGKYDDQFRVKLPFKQDGTFDGFVFDEHKNVTGIDAIEPGCKIRMLMEIGNIYLADKTFGQVLKAVQLQVFKPEKLSGFAFQESCDVNASAAEEHAEEDDMEDEDDSSNAD